MSEVNERPIAGLELTEFSRRHVAGALALSAAEGWQTYTTDPGAELSRPYGAWLRRSSRSLATPWRRSSSSSPTGDPAHLSALVVGARRRRRGLGRLLLREELAHAGGIRIDLLSRARDYFLALRADPIPGLRLRQETACAR